MATEEPQEGRCNAKVTDKVGLEIHDDGLDEVFHSGEDGRLVGVVLKMGAVETEKEPEYSEVITPLRNGFHVEYALLRSKGADDDADPVYIEIEDEDPYVTNNGTELQGFCERYPVKSENSPRCPVHQGGHAPEGNTNALKHGLYAKRSNYYKNELSDREKVIVEQFVESWLDLSSYDYDDSAVVNELYRIAVDQIRLWKAQDNFDEGMVYEQVIGQDEQGEPIITDEENPANLPYDRLDRTTYSKLTDLGVLDDPESKKADATESLADKFEELANE